MAKTLSVIFVLFGFFLLNFSCTETDKNQIDIKDTLDLQEIVKRGKLVAVTQNNSTDYFIYKGDPMGYQYELLQSLTDHLNIKLEIIVANNLDDMFSKLENKECDIIAVNLTKTLDRAKIINFTLPFSDTRQVLIQRRPEKWYSMSHKLLEGSLIRNPSELAGKTIYIEKGSCHKLRLENLAEEIADSITIVELDSLEAEEIISKVSKGEIDYAVCDENIALVNQNYYHNIDVSTPVSLSQGLSWGVRKESVELLKSINEWREILKISKKHRQIYSKYFKNKNSVNIQKSDFYSSSTGTISVFDASIKKHSKKIGWDWKLLASLIYQESKFEIGLKSWAGAFGLMQIMPTTAEYFGIDSMATPDQNIEAGVKFIKWTERYFKEIEDENERLKFLVAAYNVGPGHVLDARRLAEKYGKDKNIWEGNVAEYMLKKAKPKYYLDPVVKNGYCRGRETYDYVNEVMERYEHYKNVIKK